MKRILLLTVIALSVTACQQPPVDKDAVTANMPTDEQLQNDLANDTQQVKADVKQASADDEDASGRNDEEVAEFDEYRYKHPEIYNVDTSNMPLNANLDTELVPLDNTSGQ